MLSQGERQILAPQPPKQSMMHFSHQSGRSSSTRRPNLLLRNAYQLHGILYLSCSRESSPGSLVLNACWVAGSCMACHVPASTGVGTRVCLCLGELIHLGSLDDVIATQPLFFGSLCLSSCFGRIYVTYYCTLVLIVPCCYVLCISWYLDQQAIGREGG